MAVKIKKLSFSQAQVYGTGVGSLSDILMKLAQDQARERLKNQTDLVDNSSGVDASAIVAQKGALIPLATLSGTNAAPKAGFDTAVGKIKNAIAVVADQLNEAFTLLGMDLITDSSGGTIATDGTIPALDKSTTAVNASCLDAVSGRVTLGKIRTAIATLVGNANKLAVASGHAKLTTSLGEGYSGTMTIAAISASGTAVAGTVADSTILNSEVSTELDNIADNIASLAAFLNSITANASSSPLQVIASE